MIFKKQADILVDMIDRVSVETNKVTDFNVGSAIRALFDAFSIEAENLYMLTMENISEGIETGLMGAFDFTPREATYAYGDLTIEFNNAPTTQMIIPMGAAFSTGDVNSSLLYQTRDNYIVNPDQSTITVTVYANTSGAVGNVNANMINYVQSNVYNVARVYNKGAFLTGTDAEDYDKTKSRFQLYIESLGKATKSAIKYGALTIPEVHSVYVYEQTGLVTVYVADANGNLSDTLKTAVESVLEDYRPAGIQLVVSAMQKTLVDVSASITFINPSIVTDTTLTALSQTIQNYLNSLEADSDLIVTQLVKTLINADDNILDVELSDPIENLIIAPEEIIRAGEVTINLSQATSSTNNSSLNNGSGSSLNIINSPYVDIAITNITKLG